MTNRISKSFMLLAFTVMVIGTLTGLSVNNSLAGLSAGDEMTIVSNDLLASTDASSALKCGEGKTSVKTESKEEPETSMKCGDGKCGDGKTGEAETMKDSEKMKTEQKLESKDSKCGGSEKTEKLNADQKTESKDSKCGDGKASEKKSTDTKASETKSKCGTGKCGS